MLAIIDNGKAAEIARCIRMQSKIIKPSDFDRKASAYILSDGSLSNQKANEKIIASVEKPLLAVGAGCLFLGATYGAKIKPLKRSGTESLTLKKPCSLTTNMKKMITVVESHQNVLDALPENLFVNASSQKYEYEIISEMEKPFFGVQFLPEKGGDGLQILNNFVKFVEVWEKYHKR